MVQWRTLVASLEYDQETTEKFIQLCKKQGVTVGALMILILSISGLKFALSYDDYPDAEARHIWFCKISPFSHFLTYKMSLLTREVLLLKRLKIFLSLNLVHLVDFLSTWDFQQSLFEERSKIQWDV